jgi:hypothetical protein
MWLLELMIALLVIAILYLLFTQVIAPSAFGRRLFPAFRRDPLTQKVEATRDLVGALKEQNENLTELEVLLKQRADLEKKIAKLDPEVKQESSNTEVPNQPTKE